MGINCAVKNWQTQLTHYIFVEIKRFNVAPLNLDDQTIPILLFVWFWKSSRNSTDYLKNSFISLTRINRSFRASVIVLGDFHP